MRINPAWLLSLLVLPALALAAPAQRCQVTLTWQWTYQEPLPTWQLALTRTAQQQTTQDTHQLAAEDAETCRRSLPQAERAGFDPQQQWCGRLSLEAGAYTALLQANESTPEESSAVTFGVSKTCQAMAYDEAMRMDEPTSRSPAGAGPQPATAPRAEEPTAAPTTETPPVAANEPPAAEAPPAVTSPPVATTEPPEEEVSPEAAPANEDPAVMLTRLLARLEPILDGFAQAKQAYLARLEQITEDYQQALQALHTEAQLWEAYRRAKDRQMDAYEQIQKTWAGLLQRYQKVLLDVPGAGTTR
jgi:hypothetical protein